MQRTVLRSHEDLKVWQLARELAADIYRLTAKLPRAEQFGLQMQIRRAAVSVVSNIAEGAARESRPDFARFLSMALGSLAELETQYLLAQDLRFLGHDEAAHRKIRGVRLMLANLRRSLAR
jgi:four helix bundle protein